MMAKFTPIMLACAAIFTLLLLSSCGGSGSGIDFLNFSSDDDDQTDDQGDNPGDDQTDNPGDDQNNEPVGFDDLIPSLALATSVINDDATVPGSVADFLPGANNPGDIAAGLAEFYADGGIAYDPENNHLFVGNQFNYFVYKIDLDLDTVTWLASSGSLSGSDMFGSVGAADPVAPKDLNLNPKDLALSGEYLYVANSGSIAKIPKDGSSLARSEIQFASGSGIFSDASDLDGNGFPQTKGLVMPDNINVGRVTDLLAHDGYLYLTDSVNSTLRLISIPIESGTRRVFNYYAYAPPSGKDTFHSPVVHDDGYIYSFVYNPSTGVRIFKIPPVGDLSGDDHPFTLDDYWFSGAMTGTVTDGLAATAVFDSTVGLVSANSLLFLAGYSSQSIRVISDDGTVTTLPLVYEDPSPVALDGSLNIFSMVYAGDNLFYAAALHTVFEISLQFE